MEKAQTPGVAVIIILGIDSIIRFFVRCRCNLRDSRGNR